jgi:uncharacterized protein involved in copper resistance
MTWTYDVTTDTGKVRLFARESVQTTSIFEDEEIDTFLTIEGHVLLGAALALETIASNEVLLQKKIEVAGIKTDGPAVAAALRTSAIALRLRYEAVTAGTTDDPDWDWAEMGLTESNRAEQAWNALVANYYG